MKNLPTKSGHSRECLAEGKSATCLLCKPVNDRITMEKDMLCDFLMVNFNKAKAYKLALELLPYEALIQLKKAVRS